MNPLFLTHLKEITTQMKKDVSKLSHNSKRNFQLPVETNSSKEASQTIVLYQVIALINFTKTKISQNVLTVTF